MGHDGSDNGGDSEDSEDSEDSDAGEAGEGGMRRGRIPCGNIATCQAGCGAMGVNC